MILWFPKHLWIAHFVVLFLPHDSCDFNKTVAYFSRISSFLPIQEICSFKSIIIRGDFLALIKEMCFAKVFALSSIPGATWQIFQLIFSPLVRSHLWLLHFAIKDFTHLWMLFFCLKIAWFKHFTQFLIIFKQTLFAHCDSLVVLHLHYYSVSNYKCNCWFTNACEALVVCYDCSSI